MKRQSLHSLIKPGSLFKQVLYVCITLILMSGILLITNLPMLSLNSYVSFTLLAIGVMSVSFLLHPAYASFGALVSAAAVYVLPAAFPNLVQTPLLNTWQIIGILLFGGSTSLLHTLTQKRQWQTKRNLEHFQAVADASPHPILLKDASGNIKYASKSIERLMGRPRKELKEKGLEKWIHNDNKSKYQEFYQAVVKKPGEKQVVELRIKTKHHGWRWFRNEAINLIDDPVIGAIMTSFQDITKQVELDKERQESIAREKLARAEAEEAVRMRDEFLSIASHELKTPLTTILLHLRSTLKHTLTQSLADFSGEKLVKSLKVAQHQSERLTQMIKDLLNVSLISTGRIKIQKQPGELGPMISECIDDHQEQIEKANTTLNLVIKDPLKGMWDFIRIEQIIINLLTNALKYGEGKPVQVTVKKRNNQAAIEVKDEGPGISQEDQEKIFELFQRANNNSEKGLGVGLYISRQIARSHEGDLKLKSKPGEGSRFILTLPIVEIEDETSTTT